MILSEEHYLELYGRRGGTTSFMRSLSAFPAGEAVFVEDILRKKQKSSFIRIKEDILRQKSFQN